MERFLIAAGLGHSEKPQWTVCFRDLGRKKQENKLSSRRKTLSESVKENRDWNQSLKPGEYTIPVRNKAWGKREISEMAFHSGNTVKKQGRVGWSYHLGKEELIRKGLETGKELLKLGRFATQVREEGIGTFDICTST